MKALPCAARVTRAFYSFINQIMRKVLLFVLSLIVAQKARAAPPPYWPRYGGKRVVHLLDGTWKFGQIPQGLAFDSMDPLLDPRTIETPGTIQVPSTIDTAPLGEMGYRGVSFFRTRFSTQSVFNRIHFQACSFYCRIFVDNKEIGDHRAGGYVPFFLDVELLDAPSRPSSELLVLVDNRWNHTTAPTHTGGDFYHYSGILRSVEWHALGDIDEPPMPWRVQILPISPSTVNLSIVLTSEDYSGDIDATLCFDHRIDREIHLSGQAENGRYEIGEIPVPNPHPWSLDDPHLHTLNVTVNGGSVLERFGLRIFGVSDRGRFTMNGQIVKLVGWNHHTQWPEGGASPSLSELTSDLELLRAAGTNYVRGAHYPQDPRWMDLLDENGILLWSETLGPDVSVKNVQDPYFRTYQLQQVDEMVSAAVNHASIFVWGFFNEGPSHDEEACECYQENADALRSLDKTRFVSWASNRLLQDKCLHHADMIAFNHYPGWYDNSQPTSFWTEIADSLFDNPKTRTKPFVVSETGAGGIWEWDHNATADRWTCKLQTQLIVQDVEIALSHEHISGISLWHFFDFKTNDSTQNHTTCQYKPNLYPPVCDYIDTSFWRPGGYNHKGVVDFWRRPKESYRAVSALYKRRLVDSATEK